MTAGIPEPQPPIDTSKPHPARVYDWFLGGKENYPADRQFGQTLPEETRGNAARNRAFMHRSSAWLARDGIDQFLDIGAGIPTEPNLHQIVQAITPTARVVYADNDPIVLRHAETLLVSAPEGATDYLHADVRDPAAILERARELLDFDRPIALSLNALMHFLPDDQDPYGITRTLVGALPTGSYLALTHGTADQHPELRQETEKAYKKGAIALQMRTRAEVELFFEGLELVEPGLVPATEWYRDEPAPVVVRSGFYVGVGRVVR
ncbi:SAM-dependent methyltransferase [Streptomyces sp. NPDC002666]